jgi:hypothetical protein
VGIDPMVGHPYLGSVVHIRMQTQAWNPSPRDAAADRAGAAMVFTGLRHFPALRADRPLRRS